MKKISKITIILSIVLAVGLGLTVISNADEIKQIDAAAIVGSNATTITPAVDNTNGNETNASNTNTNKNNTNKNNTNSNSGKNIAKANVNQNLPSTGLEDYTPLFIVAGTLVVVAIVAYKKAEYYRNI